jgi:hypothetical protein
MIQRQCSVPLRAPGAATPTSASDGLLMEGRANEAFKTVRNRLRKYAPPAVIGRCIRALNRSDADTDRIISRYPPWLMLLLIKWTYIYGDFESSRFRDLDDKEFDTLLNRLHDYSGAVRFPNGKYTPFLLYRNLAFQQFWLQRPHRHDCSRLARQQLIFGSGSLPFEKLFFEQTGINIQYFLRLSLLVLAPFYNDKLAGGVTRDFFWPVESNYPPGTVDAFLSTLSLNIRAARDFLKNKKGVSPPSRFYEHYEEPVLKRYPLLREGDGFIPYSRHLLYYSLQTFVYDILKAADPEGFMNKYGPAFQKYVQKGLDYTVWNYLTEADLRKFLSTDEKLVDFVIFEPHTNIFIEAKGVEIADLGKVTHKPDVVRDKIKSSIIKAVEQAYSTANQMARLGKSSDWGMSNKDTYLVVVTFKDPYMGNGRYLYECVARETLDKIMAKYEKEWIPVEHMYFLSIDDFDCIVEAFGGRKGGLAGCLEKAVAIDRDPQTAKFVFEQHLQEQLTQWKIASYLLEALQKTCK